MRVAEKRLIDIKELMEYTGIGRNNARAFGKRVGALRTVGSRHLFDRQIIDAALDRGEPIIELAKKRYHMTEWIPVSERMPGVYECVLVCCNDDFVTVASYSRKEKRWECLTNMSADTHFPEQEEVIAWMPLPKPYERASNADSD